MLLALWIGSAGYARAQLLGPRDVDALPSSKPTLVARYGEDPLQFGDLRIPPGKGPFPIAVVIHGGCWTRGFATLRNTAAFASALTAHGVATWNIEYRQYGDPGGGWPGTFTDWASATDYLRVLARTQPLDLSRVIAIGHSAGAHAALWLASRGRLAPTSIIRGSDPLPIALAIAIDGPGDLSGFIGPDAQLCGASVVVPFMGGSPSEHPQRYAQASPYANLPLGVPQALISSIGLQPAAARDYQRVATSRGDTVKVLDIHNGGHFNIIAPPTRAGERVLRFVLGLIRGLPSRAR